MVVSCHFEEADGGLSLCVKEDPQTTMLSLKKFKTVSLLQPASSSARSLCVSHTVGEPPNWTQDCHLTSVGLLHLARLFLPVNLLREGGPPLWPGPPVVGLSNNAASD